MYTTVGPKSAPIRLFQLPNTLAGDAAVTVFVQCLITFLIDTMLVGRDLRKGNIRPIGVPKPQFADYPPVRWVLALPSPEQTLPVITPPAHELPKGPNLRPNGFIVFLENLGRALLAGVFF